MRSRSKSIIDPEISGLAKNIQQAAYKDPSTDKKIQKNGETEAGAAKSRGVLGKDPSQRDDVTISKQNFNLKRQST